jgi:hypothetical protein
VAEPERRHLGGGALIRCGQPQRELLTTASDWKYQCVRSVPGITVEREVPSPALFDLPAQAGVHPRAPFVRPAQHHGPQRGRNGNHRDESVHHTAPASHPRAVPQQDPNGHCNQTAVSGVRPPRSERSAPGRVSGKDVLRAGNGRRAVRCPSATGLRRRPSRPYDLPGVSRSKRYLHVISARSNSNRPNQLSGRSAPHTPGALTAALPGTSPRPWPSP